MTKYVYAVLPKTGLCNMLFPWARAAIYARDNACEMIAPRWVKIGRLGPWIRGETDKRYYINQFTDNNYISGVRRALLLMFMRQRIKFFSGIGQGFDAICEESEFLRAQLYKIASPAIVRAVRELPDRYIAVHIRRGDFVRIGMAIDPAYYVRGLEFAREIVGRDVPAIVFSDAPEREIAYLVKAGENVSIAPKAQALQDMLALAKADIVVGTNNSSFSLWGAFLGSGRSIWSKGSLPMREKCRFGEMMQI